MLIGNVLLLMIELKLITNFSIIGGVAFLIWATAEPQPWAQSTFAIETEDEESV